MAKNTLTVRYVGHLAAIEFDPDGLGEATFVREEPIEVADELALELLEQVNNWELVVKETPTVKSTKTAEEAK